MCSEYGLIELNIPELKLPKDFKQIIYSPLPFLLLRDTCKPGDLGQIRCFLSINGIGVLDDFTLTNFDNILLNLYPINPDKPNSWEWIEAYKNANHEPGLENETRVLILDPNFSFQGFDGLLGLYPLKHEIRLLIGSNNIKIRTSDGDKFVNLHHVHAPDPNPYTNLFELNLLYNAALYPEIFQSEC